MPPRSAVNVRTLYQFSLLVARQVLEVIAHNRTHMLIPHSQVNSTVVAPTTLFILGKRSAEQAGMCCVLTHHVDQVLHVNPFGICIHEAQNVHPLAVHRGTCPASHPYAFSESCCASDLNREGRIRTSSSMETCENNALIPCPDPPCRDGACVDKTYHGQSCKSLDVCQEGCSNKLCAVAFVAKSCPLSCGICGHENQNSHRSSLPCKDEGMWGRPCSDFDICEGCSNKLCNGSKPENWAIRASCKKSCGQCNTPNAGLCFIMLLFHATLRSQ